MKLLILSALVSLCAAGALPAFYRNPELYNRNIYNPYFNYQGYQQLRPRSDIDATAAILRSDSETGGNGFRYAYETSNGISAEASGVEANGIQSQGSYSYTGDDGQVYSVRYTAGADGFRPEGAHLPTAPPVPEAIVRSLEQNARDEASGIFDDGSYKEGKYDAFGALRNQLYNNNYYNRPYNYNYNKFYNRNY